MNFCLFAQCTGTRWQYLNLTISRSQPRTASAAHATVSLMLCRNGISLLLELTEHVHVFFTFAS